MIKFYSNGQEGVTEMPQWQPDYWIVAECPDESDIEYLCTDMGVPRSFIESLSDLDERPRFEREDGWILTILRVPLRSDDDDMSFSTVPLGIMTKGNITITLCCSPTEMVPDFIEHANRRHINIDNQPDFVLRMIYSSTYWYLHYLKEINDRVAGLTTQLERSVRNSILINLMKLQKSLVYFNTSIQGNSMLTQRLNKVFVDDCGDDLLEDVEIELAQASNTVNVYMEILSNSMDTFASVISNNVNDIMKTLTSLSVILMLPTLVASFYGMNVNVWEGSAPYAFWVIILISFILSAVIYLWLRRVRWL